MDIRHYFDTIDLDEIDRFIEDGQEENLYIEFKTVVHPIYNNENREADKKNISKVISGFANSNGGIIIWGVKAQENQNKQDVATEKKPIKELTKFLNILNRIEGQAVTPIVTGILHKKLELSEDIGFIVTYVPASNFAPHMANYSGKHYYKRSGDSFYICEHYDIKDMFQRKDSADLDLNFKNKLVRKVGARSRYEITMALHNKGRHFAKAPLLRIEINAPYRFHEYGLDGNGNVGVFQARATPGSPQSVTYMGGQDIVIYPNLEYDIDKIIIEIDSIEKLPELVVNYIIVAENMEMTSFKNTVTMEK